ncbi:MAG: YdcF family protein [Bacteroidetes bacterium]|nr:YdcF family protein [Bacteroidota bacterium]
MKINCRNKLRKILITILLIPVVGILLVILNYRMISFVASGNIYTDSSKLPFHETTLVLGAGSSPEGLWENDSFNHRMEAAAAVYDAGKTKKIIVSGMSNREFYNEPNDMKAALLLAGIPTHVIYPDHGGVRTWNSVERAQNYYKCKSVIIISQADQLERALFIARCINLDAIGLAADPLHYKHRYWTFREYLARVKCTLDYFEYRIRNL